MVSVDALDGMEIGRVATGLKRVVLGDVFVVDLLGDVVVLETTFTVETLVDATVELHVVMLEDVMLEDGVTLVVAASEDTLEEAPQETLDEVLEETPGKST
jgi:hypothetical protein